MAGSFFGFRGLGLIRAGLIGAWYEDKFTIGADVGYQGGDIDDSVYGGLYGNFYPTPNLRIGVGGTGDSAMGVGHAGVEWQPLIDDLDFGIAPYVDGSASTEGDYTALAGVRLSFSGRQRSLRDRERYDLSHSVARHGLYGAFYSIEDEIDDRDKAEDHAEAAAAAAAADSGTASSTTSSDSSSSSSSPSVDDEFDAFLAELGLL